MTSTDTPSAGTLDEAGLRLLVEQALREFTARQAQRATAQGLPVDTAQAVAEFLAAGGKRIRPVLCVTGWQAAGGAGIAAPVVRVAAALEMFHAFALIHDDLMDHSDTRRGRPTVHRAQAARHTGVRTPAQAAELGANSAVLIGDMALCWSDELLHTAGLTAGQLRRVLPLIDAMRTELIQGQYLDVTSSGRPTADVDRARRIVRYKTAKYTVERPLHIGAALAGGGRRLLDALSAFALPLGEAFQLRDDLLGVFGTERETGKPVLDDLRAGKPTVLVAHALQHADTAQLHMLSSLLGDPALTENDAARLRRLITDTGARHAVEQTIRQRHREALTALERTPIPEPVRARLRALADRTAWRTT